MKVHEAVLIKRKNRSSGQVRRGKKRSGRGNSGYRGTTAGRGTKGQRSRKNRGRIPVGFEGGQNPLKTRIPKKKGFRNYSRKEYQVINLSQISDEFKNGGKIDKEKLFRNKLIKSPKKLVKILGNGEIKQKFEIEADAFSKSAIKKIEKAGGKIIK